MTINTQEIAKLFQAKRYSELIFLIESFSEKLPPEMLNILAISRLLRKKDEESLSKALGEFKEVYTRGKQTPTGLNGLINFLNSAADFFDYLGYQDTTSRATAYLNEAVVFFKEAENYFGYEKRLISVAIRVFKRLNDLDTILAFYKKLHEKGDSTLSIFSSWIFFNNYKYNWEQKDFLSYSKLLENYCPNISKDKIYDFPKNKNLKTKIGFLSSDINKAHSITFFLKTVLDSYDREKYEIYLFLNSNVEDEGTKLFKKYVDHSINISELNDIDCINLIRKENLDIIFDLMGVTSTNRIALFKNRIAKKQISWLGYCNTTGIKNMDYLISDKNLIYEDEHDLYSEKILYLPNIWNCHAGLNFERNYLSTPLISNKFITFGSFNNFNKINEKVIKTWATILKNINGSKLILKSSTKKEIELFKNTLKKFDVLNSVVFLPTAKFFQDHLKLYENIDIALDTFPYNGVTTSFEAIWMGVPVITMKGYNFNSRCGESINNNMQMQNLIAKNEEDYVSIAANLANDKKQLSEVRKKIFDTALSSPLFNKQQFNKNFFKLIDKVN